MTDRPADVHDLAAHRCPAVATQGQGAGRWLSAIGQAARTVPRPHRTRFMAELVRNLQDAGLADVDRDDMALLDP